MSVVYAREEQVLVIPARGFGSAFLAIVVASFVDLAGNPLYVVAAVHGGLLSIQDPRRLTSAPEETPDDAGKSQPDPA